LLDRNLPLDLLLPNKKLGCEW